MEVRPPGAGDYRPDVLDRARHNCVIPVTLRFLAPHKPEHHPAMIAAFTVPDEPEPGLLSVRDDTVRAVHLTLLKPDGSAKADTAPSKFIVGSPHGLPNCSGSGKRSPPRHRRQVADVVVDHAE